MELIDYLTHEELLAQLSSRKIVIYGAGAVANYFWWSLQAEGLENRVVAVAVSHAEPGTVFQGISCKNIIDVDFDADTILCLAVHDTLLAEMKSILYAIPSKCMAVWIKPYCVGVTLHPPIAIHKRVSVREIIRKRLALTRRDYNFALRWLVIDQYRGLNDIGYELYVKMHRVYSSGNSAQKRLVRYLELIDSWFNHGYDDESVVIIDEDGVLMDGCHRTVIAAYEGRQSMFADVYPISLYRNSYIEQFLLTKERLLANGFTVEELKTVECVQRDLDKIVGYFDLYE